jgi:tricorn protease
MQGGKSGALFLAEGPPVLEDGPDVSATLQKFDLSERKVDKLIEGVNDFTVSFDGSKLLYRQGERWLTAATDAPVKEGGPPKPGIGALKLEDWQVYVEPRAMWKQMYHETWRIERDFFYDPHYHGLDLGKAERKYAPYLEGIASRDELTYLFNEALGELTVGHMFVRGGDRPQSKSPRGGLLGADFTLANDRYRLARVYNGENWNPDLQAPLTQPGVNVRAGEYVLAVNGHELHASDNIYEALQGLAGKQVVLRVGAQPDGVGARDVTVVAIADESRLRHLAWLEANRRTVEQATAGRVAYVYLPDTGGGGFTSFNRYFFSQVGKEAVIIDERDNSGGQLADYIIDYLRRPLMSRIATREGHDGASPTQAIYGPKVMIINQFAGSGGDAMPWYFRKAGIGPLVGEKTWGGLVGIGGYPELIDGGHVMAPRWAIYGLKGEWEVENHGIAPDVEVWQDPKLVREGHDPQLEKAVEVALDLLKKNPPATYPKPAYPDYHPHLPKVGE